MGGYSMFLTKYSRSQIQKEQLNDPDISPVYEEPNKA